jgi:quercetin dioxygenase-like cupin family protein
LKGTEEAVVVHLDLDPGGHSTTHAHSGDELMFVVEGTVEVRLEDSGLWTRLDRGDYVHFYAEQQHSAWNTSANPARLFIIRFYQLEATGTRFEYLKALGAKRPSANLIARVVKEVKAALAPFDLRAGRNPVPEVSDRFGLARLLQLLCSDEFRGADNGLSLKALARRAADRHLGYSPSWFDRLRHGQAPVRADELPALAEKVYEVEPLLLYDFLFPVHRNAIVVRQPRDFRPVPDDLVRSPGVRYEVPCRRLADSDLAIARLRLAPGAGTPVNRHPGHELLLPLAGVCEVRFGEVRARLDPGQHRYAHYHSRRDHQVVNVGDRPAEHLVLRFHE